MSQVLTVGKHPHCFAHPCKKITVTALKGFRTGMLGEPVICCINSSAVISEVSK